MLDAEGVDTVTGSLNTVELRAEVERGLARMDARLENWAHWARIDTGIPGCAVSMREITPDPEPNERDAIEMDRALAVMHKRRAYYWRIVELCYLRRLTDTTVSLTLKMSTTTLSAHRRQALSWLVSYFDARTGDAHA